MCNTAVDTTERHRLVADGLLRVKEAAAFLGLGRSTVYALMEHGDLCYVKIGTSRRIPRKSLEEFAAGSMVNR